MPNQAFTCKICFQLQDCFSSKADISFSLGCKHTTHQQSMAEKTYENGKEIRSVKSGRGRAWGLHVRFRSGWLWVQFPTTPPKTFRQADWHWLPNEQIAHWIMLLQKFQKSQIQKKQINSLRLNEKYSTSVMFWIILNPISKTARVRYCNHGGIPPTYLPLACHTLSLGVNHSRQNGAVFLYQGCILLRSFCRSLFLFLWQGRIRWTTLLPDSLQHGGKVHGFKIQQFYPIVYYTVQCTLEPSLR